MRKRTFGSARMFSTQADAQLVAIVSTVGRIITMYALFPLRITWMHLRRALPVLRPVVVSTPNPEGGRAVKNGSIIALRTRPPLADCMNGLRFRSGTNTGPVNPTRTGRGSHQQSQSFLPHRFIRTIRTVRQRSEDVKRS
jgi:hypothetical protein